MSWVRNIWGPFVCFYCHSNNPIGVTEDGKYICEKCINKNNGVSENERK